MNAPDRGALRAAPPLLIALAGGMGSGRRSTAKILKTKHGFATSAFQQPLVDAIHPLYGASPMDLLFDPAAPIERLGRSPQDLIASLRAHAETIAGEDILIRRLAERTVARGEWGQQDLVITDLSTAAEINWLRKMGGSVWWIRRWSSATEPTTIAISKLALCHWSFGDMAIINDDTIDALSTKVEEQLARAQPVTA